MVKNKYTVLGVMSGTSLDGLDLCVCDFIHTDKWKFEIKKCKTVSYDSYMKERLISCSQDAAMNFVLFNNEYGRYIGNKINEFLQSESIKIDFIASHGHTIFHQPQKNMTYQLGSGTSIAAETGITCISDFRVTDVALGGQGAPLVPIGDELLFAYYDVCVNIGGFANLSYHANNKRIAFDICPANIILNKLSQLFGKDYDDGGVIGRSGIVHKQLLEELNSIEYYHTDAPKSLGREWLEDVFEKILNKYSILEQDKMRSLYEHIGFQIAKSIEIKNDCNVLITGGGAFNTFLIENIKKYSNAIIAIPSTEVINYKEALIFGFLGVLRMENQCNCLASVTGARRDNIGGVIYLA